MVEISVIIPVYNSEEYLRECLDSILNQTFKNIEIICINDGSTDHSLKFLKDYQKKDSRLKIFNQENNGAASARNVGIKQSKGKYIYFMDSDDILELTALEELHTLAERKKLDLIIFKLINFDDGNRKKYMSDYYEMTFLKDLVGEKVFNYNDIGEKLFKIAVSPPGKFFQKDLIYDISFPEGYIFEDNAFFTEVILKAKSVFFYDKHLYNRRVRSDSVMGNRNLKQADIIPIFNKMIDIVIKYDCFDEFKSFLLEYKVSIINMRFGLVEDKFKNEFFIRIKNDFNDYKNYFDEVFNEFKHENKIFYENVLEYDNYREFELNLKINDVTHEIKQTKKNINELKKENDFLNSQIKLINEKNDSIINSKSWRITKPIRNVGKLFK